MRLDITYIVEGMNTIHKVDSLWCSSCTSLAHFVEIFEKKTFKPIVKTITYKGETYHV